MPGLQLAANDRGSRRCGVDRVHEKVLTFQPPCRITFKVAGMMYDNLFGFGLY